MKNANNMILGLGSAGSRVVKRYIEMNPCINNSNFLFATRDCLNSGLNGGFIFDEAYGLDFSQLLDGVNSLLIVVCIGGRAGGTMARFFSLLARTKNIPVHVVFSYPFAFEGSRRKWRLITFKDDIKLMGVGFDPVICHIPEDEIDEITHDEVTDRFDDLLFVKIDKWVNALR